MYDYNGVGSAIIITRHRAGARHGARGRLFYSITATRPIRRRARLKVRRAIGPLIGTALFAAALAVIWGS
jgi:hypothetical protein